jgi:NitT/TauT family transport system ATP-binding protein
VTLSATGAERVAAATRSALAAEDVTKVFGAGPQRTVALDGVSLAVQPGEFVTIVGASGCGKTTLLNLFAGLDAPTSGSVFRASKPALMFQEATLLPWLSARRNVELALKLAGVGKEERRRRAVELLGVVRLEGWEERKPHELSGGMKQRVALARCLAQDTSIILMDEPLGALDAMTRDHLHDEIESIVAERDLTVVFVTHNMREAVRLADRVVLMGGGRILHEQRVDLRRPRIMDSPDVAERAADLTARLKSGGQLRGADA